MMKPNVIVLGLPLLAALILLPRALADSAAAPEASIRGGDLSVQLFSDGSYALRSAAIAGNVLRATIQAETETGTLTPSLYPRHSQSLVSFHDEMGQGKSLTVTYTGQSSRPDLVCAFRVYDDRPWGDIQVRLVNTTGHSLVIRAVHILQAAGGEVVNLDGPAADDRVLSDSFTEDPSQLMDLGQPGDGLHRSFGSQLIFNRKSGAGLFLGALSAGRLLTIFRLQATAGAGARALSYDVEDAGTNDALHDQSLPYGPENQVPLRLEVPPGETFATEPLMFAIGRDYHAQLENYGAAVRVLRKAPVFGPTLIGWWSWTAYYYGVTEGAMVTNADWLAQNLLPLGYRYFQMDEGYQYARGEYATPDGRAFPHGVAPLGRRVQNDGLIFGLWVAPFQVSARSWVYEHHRDWLVRNLQNQPIHIGRVGGIGEELYALDTTDPGAREYLRQTYRTLVRDWGVRFLKLDFMDSASVEGVHYRANTTALEALRIGLQTIREAVGDGVLLDKDGSPMLTPVGIVDTGRISLDTGHTFAATRDAAPGIAARYYMNRNFYQADPDAFTVSEQVVPDRGWHGNKVPLTLDEGEASIALSAVSGGMFEIGDDLPALGASPQRLALVRNPELLDMVRLGRASIPLDLMTYRPQDKQPSIFLLKEDNRQSILTIFNWTEQPLGHAIDLRALGLQDQSSVTATDVLRGGDVAIRNCQIAVDQPAHSVRVFKLIQNSVPAAAPGFEASLPATAHAGDNIAVSATAAAATPVLEFRWSFGDGVTAEGPRAAHTYTQPGSYTVTVQAIGLEKRTSEMKKTILVSGHMPTIYDPSIKERYAGDR